MRAEAQAVLSLQSQARPAGLQAPPSPAGLRLSPLEALAERELPAAVSWREHGNGEREGEHSFQVRGSGTAAACHAFAVSSCQPLGGEGGSETGLLADCWVAAHGLSALGNWTLILIMVNLGVLHRG